MNCKKCGEPLMKWRDYWGCPNGHGRLIPDGTVEQTRKPPETPEWKLTLPVAERRGLVVSDGNRYSIYAIDGKPYYASEWRTPNDEEVEACVVNSAGQRAVRRFAPYKWLTDEQKKRLSF